DTHAPTLERLLHTMVHVNVFKVDEDGYYHLTSLSKLLQTNALRSTVLTFGQPCVWQTWGSLLYSVKTGAPSFDKLHQMSFYQYLGHDPNANSTFYQCMTSGPRHDQVVNTYNGFAHVNSVVDVGGGHGGLLIRSLTKYKHLKGILYDLPHATSTIDIQHIDKSIADRLTIMTGDMFSNVPADGDMYIISHVIIDISDEKAKVLLHNCRQAMKNGKCLLIIDIIKTSSTDVSTNQFWKEISDLHVLVLCGTRMRTEAEFRMLLENQKFKVNKIIPISSSLLHAGNILESIAI
ncbi:unnamed protein product, partial [Rotaria sordida]